MAVRIVAIVIVEVNVKVDGECHANTYYHAFFISWS